MIESYIWVSMTDKQLNALKKMTSSSMFRRTTWWACDLDIGRVRVNRLSNDSYELEYPTHYVTLRRGKRVTGYDLNYLRVLYNEWNTYIENRE
jgi:hypothetical protein